MNKQGWTIVIISLSIIFGVAGFIFLHKFFDKDTSAFSIEIMAAGQSPIVS